MSAAFQGWTWAIMAFVVFLMSLPVALRAAGKQRHVVEIVVGVAACPFGVCLTLLAKMSGSDSLWSFTALYAFLFAVFLQAFGVVYKSISLRMLSELVNLPGRCLAIEESHCKLVAEDAYLRRVANLREGGLVTQDGQDVQLTAKGRQVVGWISTLQRLFGIASSG